MDRVSSAGYALGYVGGGLLLALVLAWIQKPQWFGLPSGPDLTPAQQTLPTRLSFVAVAVWWTVFAIPLFRHVTEPPATGDGRVDLGGAFRELGHTFRRLGRFKQAGLMLVAFLIYNDGIGTIIRMAGIYGAELGIDSGSLIAAIMITQFVGVPFAFLFGMIANRIGAKRAIFGGLVVYAGITVFGYYMTTAAHFLILALLVGMVQGGTQALSRSLFASMIPKQRSAEFFGFFAVVEKFAGILGPLVFSVMINATGSGRRGGRGGGGGPSLSRRLPILRNRYKRGHWADRESPTSESPPPNANPGDAWPKSSLVTGRALSKEMNP